MDAKLTPDRNTPIDSPKHIGMSGYRLFLSLGAGLGIAALSIDWLAGRSLLAGGLTLPLVASALVAGGLGCWAVPLLRNLKTGQVIRQDGPQAHLKKAGTPTMGGIFFVPAAVLVGLLWTGFAPNVVAVSALTLSYAGIGWLDDWQILRRKSNKGISPQLKLALQVLFGGLFCAWLLWSQPTEITTLVFPFGLSLSLGLLFLPLAWFVLVAESNATNLTDGLDGLAGGTAAIALLGLGGAGWGDSPRANGILRLPERWLPGISGAQPQSGARLHGRHGISGAGWGAGGCGAVDPLALCAAAAERDIFGRNAVSDCAGPASIRPPKTKAA